MTELPRAGRDENDDLCNAVPDCTCVCGLAEVAVVCLSLPLVLLLPPDILELEVEVADLCSEAGDVCAVLLDVGFCCADYDVEVEADVGVGEPGGVVCGETDGVVACVVGGKGELAVWGADCFDEDVFRL